jgi:hypothetical protein
MIIYINHHAIVTNLYWFKTPFSVSFDCYVNIDIEEKKEKWRDRLFDFIHTFLFTAMAAALSEHAFYTIIERERKKNKKIFPIFNQTISYKWTVYPLDVPTLIVWINNRQNKTKRTDEWSPLWQQWNGSLTFNHNLIVKLDWSIVKNRF